MPISIIFGDSVCQATEANALKRQVLSPILTPSWGARGRRFESFHTDQKR